MDDFAELLEDFGDPDRYDVIEDYDDYAYMDEVYSAIKHPFQGEI